MSDIKTLSDLRRPANEPPPHHRGRDLGGPLQLLARHAQCIRGITLASRLAVPDA
ncbi:MAG: hypothetical protein WA820_13185 [Bradyrhizobium sp.]